VIALGRSMKMTVVAEGVESQAQAMALRELGCHEIQGYLLGRPMPGSDFAGWLVNHNRNRPRKRSRSRYSDTSPITLFSLLDTAGA
jgi:predicted signal transduction protein with EAL and GGDEF domain